MNIDDIKKQQEDLDFFKAIYDLANIEGESLLEENAALQSNPQIIQGRDENEERFSYLMKKEIHKKAVRPNVKKKLKKMVLVVAILQAVLLLSVVIACAAFSDDILNWAISTKANGDIAVNLKNGVYLADINIPDYIPDGFIAEKPLEVAENVKSIKFVNNKNWFTFTQQSGKISGELDAEQAQETSKIEIGEGREGYYIEKNGIVKLYWKKLDKNYILEGNIDKKEILKIAESIK